MIATENCYRLARSLHSSMSKIPYEDAQIAATQLLQCASNVLTVGLDQSQNDSNERERFRQ